MKLIVFIIKIYFLLGKKGRPKKTEDKMQNEENSIKSNKDWVQTNFGRLKSIWSYEKIYQTLIYKFW